MTGPQNNGREWNKYALGPGNSLQTLRREVLPLLEPVDDSSGKWPRYETVPILLRVFWSHDQTALWYHQTEASSDNSLCSDPLAASSDYSVN